MTAYLLWTGHIMDDSRFAKIISFSELQDRAHSLGGHMKHFRDLLIANLEM